jgi:hypothetical protein
MRNRKPRCGLWGGAFTTSGQPAKMLTNSFVANGDDVGFGMNTPDAGDGDGDSVIQGGNNG